MVVTRLSPASIFIGPIWLWHCHILEEEVKVSVNREMLRSMSVRAKPMGTSDVPFLDDSSDLGSLECKGANGLCDGDLATAVGFNP